MQNPDQPQQGITLPKNNTTLSETNSDVKKGPDWNNLNCLEQCFMVFVGFLLLFGLCFAALPFYLMYLEHAGIQICNIALMREFNYCNDVYTRRINYPCPESTKQCTEIVKINGSCVERLHEWAECEFDWECDVVQSPKGFTVSKYCNACQCVHHRL